MDRDFAGLAEHRGCVEHAAACWDVESGRHLGYPALGAGDEPAGPPLGRLAFGPVPKSPRPSGYVHPAVRLHTYSTSPQ